jgi:hypothetical protein
MSIFLGAVKGIGKITSVDNFVKFLNDKTPYSFDMNEEFFVYNLFKYSKELVGKKSLKGMSYNAIYKSNPKINDWISYYRLDGEEIIEIIKKISKK